MKQIGIFEVKTRLSEICEEVATTLEPVTVTKRGQPLVRIDPLSSGEMTVRDRRETYMATYGVDEQDDDVDFEVPSRSPDVSDFKIEE